MDNENIKEIYIQNGVFLKKASATHISAINNIGVLSFCRNNKTGLYFFDWKQEQVCDVLDTESQDSGWSLVDTIEHTSSSPVHSGNDQNKPSDTNSNTDINSKENQKGSIVVNFRDLRCMEFVRNELRLHSRDGVHSSYLFNHGSPQSLIAYLERRQFVKRSSRRKQLYHCLEGVENDKLQRSFSELNIEDIQNRPRQSTYYDLMSKFANVHQMLPIIRHSEEFRSRSGSYSGSENTVDHHASYKDRVEKHEVDSEPESSNLVPRTQVHRGPPLDSVKWNASQAPNGSVKDANQIKQIIFNGGIENNIRPEVWKYLLGLDIWEHDSRQKEERRASKTKEYFQMKLQWLTITPTQEQNFTGYRERKCQIEKDVKRTDRTYDFFAGDDNPNLTKLQDILMTYVMYNFDLGYVQGMSDLLAPILILVQNEADSFWCFVGFMQKVFNNFDIDQKGMKLQLKHLRDLLAFVNKKLFNYLTKHQSEEMYFCFRWLLVWFKREFSNTDIMRLWEVLWTGLPCPNFHLFICVAILDQETNVFISSQFTFNEILKHVNELSGNLNLAAILERAESIYLQVKSTLELSKEAHTELRKIIGEEVTPDGGGSSLSDEEDDSSILIVNDKSTEEQELMQRKVDEACDLSMSYALF